MEWMLLPYQRYAEFDGRSRRMEYWSYTVFVLIVSVLLVLPVVFMGENPSGFLFIPVGIWFIGNIIPSIAVTIRRWHDLDQSGWFYLLFAVLGAIPFIGLIAGLVNLVWFFMQGTVGENKYGQDPK
jgi:uncharacterized membrane protein YhaH (DUF805 family)